MENSNEIFWRVYGILKEREAYCDASKKEVDSGRGNCPRRD